MISSSFGISGPIGLVLAGPIIQQLSWRYLFVIGAGGMGVAAALARAFIPESPVRAGQKVDVAGAAALAATLIALLVVFTEGNAWGWLGGRTLALFALAAALAVLWGRIERKSVAPMVDLTMLANRPMLLTNLATFFVGAGTFAAFLLLPGFMETPMQFAPEWRHVATYGFAASVSVASLLLVPGSAVGIALGPLTGKLLPRFGAGRLFVAHAALVTAGPVMLALLHDQGWQVSLALVVMGSGVAIGLATAPTLISDSAKVTDTGVANGINSIMRTIGGVVGAQIAAALIAGRTIGDSPIPAEWGFSASWWFAAACGVLAAVFALPLVRRARSPV